MANPNPVTAHLKRTAGPGRTRGSKNRVTIERVETEIRRLAFFDPRALIAKVGRGKAATFTLKEMAHLPDDVAACIASFDVVTDNLTTGDKRQDTVIRVRWYDKREMLALLAKHFGYVSDRAAESITVASELLQLLEAGRARNAARLAAGVLPVVDVSPMPDRVAGLPADIDAADVVVPR
jgi:hypothetical protein